MISIGLIILALLAVLLLLALIGWGGFWLLIQLGVIVHEARKPAYSDTNDYRLSQGREAGRDEPRR